jgi:hypothetical protein
VSGERSVVRGNFDCQKEIINSKMRLIILSAYNLRVIIMIK